MMIWRVFNDLGVPLVLGEPQTSEAGKGHVGNLAGIEYKIVRTREAGNRVGSVALEVIPGWGTQIGGIHSALAHGG